MVSSQDHLATTTQTWHELVWDSDFFGFPIGRIDLDGADAARIAEAESEARAAGIACLYSELDPGAIDSIDFAQRRGYRLMDVALDLEHRTSVLAHPPPTRSSVRVGTIDDLARLAEQIAIVAPWSRYAVDPRFGARAALAMHRAWVERALTEPGRMLLVAEDSTGITGMSTVSTSPRPAASDTSFAAGPRIDLIASTKYQSGAAQALVAHAFECFGPGLSRGGPIAARNVVSLRFSEHMGYRVARTRYLFHRWLDEDEPSKPSTPARGRPMMSDMDPRPSVAVTDHQRTFFDAFGYLILPGLFAEDIAEITDAFDAVFDDPANPRLELNIVGHRFHSRFAMGHFVELHPRLTAVAADERLTCAANALLGPGAAYVDSDGSIYCCETEWHYDSPTREKDRRHLKFTFYLDPLDEKSGAPRVLPVSHHDPDLYRGPLEPYLGFDGAIEERTGLRGEELPNRVLPTAPGDVLVWDFRVMHCSYGSTEPRRQFALNFRSGPDNTESAVSA